MPESWQHFIESIDLNGRPHPLAHNAIYPLTTHRFIDINGIDAAKFLQGQLSCDIQQISLVQSGIGSHSNAKGRMQSSFRICRHEENAFLLRVHRSIQEQAKNALAKYIVFSKATISINNDWIGIGLHGENARKNLGIYFSSIPDKDYQQHIEKGYIIICTSAGKNSYEIYTHPDQAIILWQALSQDLQPCKPQEHQLLENNLGLAFVENTTFDKFTPQMFNYQVTPAISFKKGCYTGQEIVARMHYLGKIKRHLRHYTAKSTQEIFTGDTLSTITNEQGIGDIVSAVKTGESQWDLLANIIDDAMNNETLRAGDSVLSQLTLIDLPYLLNE